MHSAPLLELQLMAATLRSRHRQHVDRTESTNEADGANIEPIEPSTSLA